MKANKKTVHKEQLSGEQIVKKKLDEANAMLRRVDLSKIIITPASKQD